MAINKPSILLIPSSLASPDIHDPVVALGSNAVLHDDDDGRDVESRVLMEMNDLGWITLADAAQSARLILSDLPPAEAEA